MEIDTTAEFGKRVQRRLQEERIIWLTTVDAANAPQPRPVWFLWDGGTFLIYSQPDKAKLRHIAGNPRVALHFDGNGRGGDIVVFTGEATLPEDAPPADEVPAYVEKYRERMAHLGYSPEKFARDYSVSLRVRPEQVRGH